MAVSRIYVFILICESVKPISPTRQKVRAQRYFFAADIRAKKSFYFSTQYRVSHSHTNVIHVIQFEICHTFSYKVIQFGQLLPNDIQMS